MRYYIADCHFYHESLIRQMDCRAFASVDEMNRIMLERWNDRVRKRDEVVILGDLSLGTAEQTNDLLDHLNGRLMLVRGNHDRFGKNASYRTDRFEWIRDYAELKDNNRRVILCHYPIMFYNGQYQLQKIKTGGLPFVKPLTRDERDQKTWMLYGHVHLTTDEVLMRRFIRMTRETVRTSQDGEAYHIPCQMINCFCMLSDYTPLSLDEWIENDRKREEMEQDGE